MKAFHFRVQALSHRTVLLFLNPSCGRRVLPCCGCALKISENSRVFSWQTRLYSAYSAIHCYGAIGNSLQMRQISTGSVLRKGPSSKDTDAYGLFAPTPTTKSDDQSNQDEIDTQTEDEEDKSERSWNGQTSKKDEIKFLSAGHPTVQHSAPTFRATKVYYTGEMETLNVKSTELLKSSKIHARDLFDLNLTSRQERRSRLASPRTGPVRVQRGMAAIVGRPTSIVVSFGKFRAIVGRHSVLFLEAYDPAVQDFARELAERYKQIANKNDNIWNGQEAMELVFLEEMLRNSIESFNRQLSLYEPIVNSFLDSVADEVYSDTGVHQLVPLKDSLQSFEMHVKQCLDCLTQLLDDDEEMLALLLTEQTKARETGQPVDFQRHEHVELLLGVYARQLNNTLMEIQFLLQRIQSKQEFVTIALAGYRNRMVRMDVSLSIATLSLCLGTTVAAFYGMNVVNGLEESTSAFYTIVGTSSVAGLAFGVIAFNYLSGRTMQNRAATRMGEIETLSRALSNMSALDYVVKKFLEHGVSITRDEFRSQLRKARQSGEVTDREVDLLFRILDTIKDGVITKDDMDLLGLSRTSPSSHPAQSSRR